MLYFVRLDFIIILFLNPRKAITQVLNRANLSLRLIKPAPRHCNITFSSLQTQLHCYLSYQLIVDRGESLSVNLIEIRYNYSTLIIRL